MSVFILIAVFAFLIIGMPTAVAIDEPKGRRAVPFFGFMVIMVTLLGTPFVAAYFGSNLAMFFGSLFVAGIIIATTFSLLFRYQR